MPDDVLKPRCGRLKTYGIKMTPEAVQSLPVPEVKPTLYCKEQLVLLPTVVGVVRFLTRPLTGGLVARWLRMEFTGFAFRDSFNRKSSISTFPKLRGDPRLRV